MEEELNRPAFSRCTGQNSPGGSGVPTESCGDQNFLKSWLGESPAHGLCPPPLGGNHRPANKDEIKEKALVPRGHRARNSV